jgi:hypothetical protein
MIERSLDTIPSQVSTAAGADAHLAFCIDLIQTVYRQGDSLVQLALQTMWLLWDLSEPECNVYGYLALLANAHMLQAWNQPTQWCQALHRHAIMSITSITSSAATSPFATSASSVSLMMEQGLMQYIERQTSALEAAITADEAQQSVVRNNYVKHKRQRQHRRSIMASGEEKSQEKKTDDDDDENDENENDDNREEEDEGRPYVFKALHALVMYRSQVEYCLAAKVMMHHEYASTVVAALLKSCCSMWQRFWSLRVTEELNRIAPSVTSPRHQPPQSPLQPYPREDKHVLTHLHVEGLVLFQTILSPWLEDEDKLPKQPHSNVVPHTDEEHPSSSKSHSYHNGHATQNQSMRSNTTSASSSSSSTTTSSSRIHNVASLLRTLETKTKRVAVDALRDQYHVQTQIFRLCLRRDHH